jgi:hypothetical protein
MMALSSSSQSSIAKTEELQRQVEARRIARTIIVPTNDDQVRLKLREIGEPITLFGERVRSACPPLCDSCLVVCRKRAGIWSSSTCVCLMRRPSWNASLLQAPERRERLQQLMAQRVADGEVAEAASVLVQCLSNSVSSSSSSLSAFLLLLLFPCCFRALFWLYVLSSMLIDCWWALAFYHQIARFVEPQTHHDQKSRAQALAEEREKQAAAGGMAVDSESGDGTVSQYITYSEGSADLKVARTRIAEFSLPRYAVSTLASSVNGFVYLIILFWFYLCGRLGQGARTASGCYAGPRRSSQEYGARKNGMPW